jgi:hypothetical protein
MAAVSMAAVSTAAVSMVAFTTVDSIVALDRGSVWAHSA